MIWQVLHGNWRRKHPPSPSAGGERLGKCVLLVVVLLMPPGDMKRPTWARLDLEQQVSSFTVEQAGTQDTLQAEEKQPSREQIDRQKTIETLKKEELAAAKILLAEYPHAEDVLVIMGNVMYRQGRVDQARSYWQQALAIDPRRADVYAIMGRVAFVEGQFKTAVEHYRTALKIQPRQPEAYLNLGHALLMLGRHDEALAALQEAIALRPDHAFAYFLLGQVHLQQQDYEAARKQYEAALRLQPEFANPYYGLATVYTRLGQPEKARTYAKRFRQTKQQERQHIMGRKIAFDDFTETRKNSALTFFEIGRFYYRHGKADQAEPLLARAARLAPDRLECRLLLAELYRKIREPEKAYHTYEVICRLDAGNPKHYIERAILAVQLRRLDAAEEILRQAVRAAPDQSLGYRYLASFYLETRRHRAKARELAEKAVQLEPLPDNYYILAWACARNGDKNSALAAIDKALALDPSNAQYRRMRALIQQGK